VICTSRSDQLQYRGDRLQWFVQVEVINYSIEVIGYSGQVEVINYSTEVIGYSGLYK